MDMRSVGKEGGIKDRWEQEERNESKESLEETLEGWCMNAYRPSPFISVLDLDLMLLNDFNILREWLSATTSSDICSRFVFAKVTQLWINKSYGFYESYNKKKMSDVLVTIHNHPFAFNCWSNGPDNVS